MMHLGGPVRPHNGQREGRVLDRLHGLLILAQFVMI